MKKRLKKGTKVLCIVAVENFTKGKDYKVLGNAPLNKLIIKGDNGKRSFPHGAAFKKITWIMQLKKLIYGKY